ncbi:MAG: tetratricopeptide repeat protein [Flavobacteriaceae bacterium]
MENEELISKYFLDELSPEELEQFHALLENDPEFKEQFTFEEDLRKVIAFDEKRALKEKLAHLEEELPPLTTSRRPLWKRLSIAASILVLLGLGYFVFKPDTPDMNKLYASNFEIYPNTVYTITRSDTINSVERKAFVAYESGDFKAAIPLFEQMKAEGEKAYLDFYLAQSYLKTERTTEAVTHFQKNLETNEIFVPESRWYLALAYLNLGEGEKAKEMLKSLLNSSDYKQEAAEALLAALD